MKSRKLHFLPPLTLSWQRSLSYRNQSIDLLSQSMDWFVYDGDFRHERVKVARVVKLKLAFMEWFFYNLVIVIKLYKIRYLNLDKVLLFSRKQVICLKNWKVWRAPTTTKFNIFWRNFAHFSYLTMSTKGCSGFFLFCLDPELLIKYKKWVCRNQFIFYFCK